MSIEIELVRLADLLHSSLRADAITRIVVGAVIKNEGGCILLLKRSSDDFMGGLDELPSGRVEPTDQTLFDAVRREVLEETGLVVDQFTKYLGHFDYMSKSGTPTRQFNFAVTIVSGGQIRLSSEHQSASWVRPSEATNLNASPEVLKLLTK